MCHKNTTDLSHIDSTSIRTFTAGTSRCVADLWTGMLPLSVQMWERPPAAVSACVTLCIVGSSWLTRWSRWQWNPGDWMGHFAGTLHTTFCSFKITYENGSGPVSLIIKEKHTSFPWQILRLGCNSPPTMDNRRSSKDVGPSVISISKKHLKLKKKTNSLYKMSWGGGSLWERTRSRGVNPHTYQQRRSAHVALIRKGHRRVDLALAPGSFAAESGNCSFFCACYRWSAARVLSYATVKPSIYLKNTQRPSATQLTHMCSNFSPVSITATEK